jgi:DinB superfamily
MNETRTPFFRGALSWLYDDRPQARCAECGYDWGMSFGDTIELVNGSPDRFVAALAGRDGMARQDDGSWNATAYVWHLVDFSRSWTERWYQVIDDPGSTLVGWDPDEIANLRGYRSLPTVPALRMLRSSVAALVDATREAGEDARFVHGDWGDGNVGDATAWIGHEFHHHEQDVRARAV